MRCYVGLISVITLFATISVVTGLSQGIKWLSNINLGLAGVLLIAVLAFGPTLFLLRNMVESFGVYLVERPPDHLRHLRLHRRCRAGVAELLVDLLLGLVDLLGTFRRCLHRPDLARAHRA